jgi:hypothetical protein
MGLSDAGRDVNNVAELLAMPLDAAVRARTSNRAAEQTIEELHRFRERVAQFRSPAAPWQARLTADAQQVSAALDDDRRTRTLALEARIDGRVDDDAPTDELQFEAWLQKVAVEEVVGHYRLIAERAGALAADVADDFAELDRHQAFVAEAAAPTDRLAEVHVDREPQRLLKDGVARRLVTTGQSYSGGVVLVSSVVGVVSAIPWIPLLALPLAGLLARRALTGDRERRLEAHRDELKRLGRHYVSEIMVVVADDGQATLQRIDGEIRQHFLARADELDITLRQAIAAVERWSTAADTPDTAGDRASIRDAVSAARRLVSTGPGVR